MKMYEIQRRGQTVYIVSEGTGEKDPLRQYVGRLVAIQPLGKDPVPGRLEKSDLECFWYRFISCSLSVSIPADCPEPTVEGYKVERVGRSGIGARNRWVVHLTPVEERELPTLVEEEKSFTQPGWDLRYRLERKKVPMPDLGEREKVEELLHSHRSRYFEEERVRKAELWLRGWDAAVIGEFNKAPFFGRPPEGYLASFVKETSCGNTTVVLLRNKETVKVPPELKGLVIGKGGRRIKAFEERAGHRIRII